MGYPRKNINRIWFSFRKSSFSIVLLIPLFFLSTANAQTDSEIKAENEQLKKQSEEIKSKEQQAKNQVNTQVETVGTLSSKLKDLDLKVNTISSKVSFEQTKLRSAQAEVQNLNDEATEMQKEIKILRKKIGDKAIAGYQLGEVKKVEIRDATNSVRMQNILETVTETQIEDVDKLGDLVVSLNEQKALAEILEKEILKSKAALEKDQAELVIAQQAQKEAVDSAERILEARLAEAAVLQERDSELAAKIQENTSELANRAARRKNPSPPTASFTSVKAGEIVKVQGIWVHESIAGNFGRLMSAAKADGVNLAGWGYRDSAKQIELRKRHCGTSNYAVYQMSSSRCSPPTARPGASQHERGLAIDFTYNGGSIGTRSNKGYKWLNANAAKYGLYNLPSEPWHWSTTGN